ncbi:hypothetical protein AeNC1_008809 [Aphanomyces euteiches]|nr:hypothetical protein AeNC1_008809 [Aphanomyces euteiches]
MLDAWNALVKGENLLEAAKGGDLKKVRALLDDDANVNYNDKNDETALHWASRKGHLDIVQELLARQDENRLMLLEQDGETALHLASSKGHLDIVKELLVHAASIDVANHDGVTALQRAAWYGHLETVKELLARGASIDVANKNGVTALQWALMNGHLDIVKELLTCGASVDLTNNNGESALYWASRKGHLEIVKELLASGASTGMMALHGASWNGHLNIVKELLARGASVNAASKDGETALYLASSNGHVDVVKELLARGAPIDVASKDGWTALHRASGKGHLDVVRVLLAHGASVDVVDNDGETALHWASMYGKSKIVKDLLACGASLDTASKNGDTALHDASRQGRLEFLKILLDAGADKHLTNKDGETARDVGSDKVKAFFDNYSQSKIYSIIAATDLIRQTLGDIKGITSDLITTGSTILDLSLRVKIHRQRVLTIGLLVANVLCQTKSQASPNEQNEILSVLKNIQTYFQSTLVAFHPWTLHKNAHIIQNIAETVFLFQEQLIQAAQNFIFNPNLRVMGTAEEDLRHDLEKILDKLENIDNILKLVVEIPVHRQMDALYELLIQLQRGFEYYERQVAWGNIQHNADFENEVRLCQGKIYNVIDGMKQAKGISDSFQRDEIKPWMLSSDDVEFDPNDQSMVLGRGGFATVFKGTCYGQAVAVKRFDQILNIDAAALEKMIAKEING